MNHYKHEFQKVHCNLIFWRKKNEQILQTTHEWVNDYDDKGKLDIEQHSLKARI